ncbi:GPP34 family phosphoprotein [Rhodococcus sp. IEGM 1351]|uniref:GOLPH3/VPS74 family protein n=1 Tax=Rhodococcus sp. IEGM 1351 TaxID=3047089 RepID=UPI0024B876BD|nr:GPP34 family phosphoprotein [Rhodococcus sp. IEGM 1351]MDI9941224.1 GPP34 family phosphoprotein [Rhodococcus sp. IEGM 1351]
MDSVPPLPLWKRLYLLCTRPDGQVTEYDELGALVRAGVLAELYLTGEITDRTGHAYAECRQAHPGALEQQLITQIAASRPRTWEHWIGTDPRPTERLARDQLVSEGLVTPERHRVLGMVPHTRYRASDLELTARLRAAVEDTLRAAKADEPDHDAMTRAAQDALSMLPDNVKSLPRKQKRQLRAEFRARAEANLRAAHPRGQGRAVDDTDAAFTALAVRIPYRCKNFQIKGDYYDQIRYLTKRIGPIAPALSSVFSGMKWARAASTT